MASTTLTPAQKLAAKHDENDTHQPKVEDVVDEEDIIHPPPSAILSEKAAGKQKATDAPPKKKEPTLNTQSEEAFPSLGAPKAAPAPVNTSWSKKPSFAANGVNGSGNANAARGPAAGRPNGPGIALPGRHTDYMTILAPHMIPPKELKKPVKSVLDDINKRSRANVTMQETIKELPGQNKGVSAFTFQAQGPTREDILKALKEVATTLGAKQKINVSVPASLRPFIIGKGGATINRIKELSGANIQVPKQDSNAGPEDDDAEIQVIVEGDSLAAGTAQAEIMKIVNERTSTVNQRLGDIPPEYFPFLSRFAQGQKGVNVSVPAYHSWTSQPPQSASSQGQPAAFASQPNHSIGISGDRERAQVVKAEIEREIENLKRQLSTRSVVIDRPRHQFIAGNRGISHDDFLKETGCAIIFPPEDDDDDNVYLVGPAGQLERAEEKAFDLADAPKLTKIDVAKQHRGANGGAAHAQALSQYLRQRRAFEKLEKQHDAAIVVPQGQSSFEIYTGEGKSAREVQQDIVNMILSHPPARVSSMPLNPFFIPHIRQSYAPQIRNDHGVFLAIPDEFDENPRLVFVYEAPGASNQYEIPRGAPQANESANFAKALSEAQKVIEGLVKGQQEIQSQHVEAPTKFHDKIRRYVDREQQELSQGQVPVQLLIGNQRPQEARNRDGLLLRGPKDALSQWQAQILEFIEQERRDELERSYTTSCDFPQQYIKNLVGSGGSNINQLREEFDVDIKAGEGKVDFKGPQAKAEKAKAHVLELAKKLSDESTHELKIRPQYHRDLIGAKGAQVNRLQDRYNVRINFPRTKAFSTDGDDTATDAGHQKNQGDPEAVFIRGPSSGADAARKELLELYRWYQDNGHTATVSVAQSQIPSLIGSGGREMEKIRQETGAAIDVPNASAGADDKGRVQINIKGTKEAVEEARKLLQSRAKTFDNTITKTIDVEKQHHKTLIGSGGSNIRDIVVKAGGPDDRREVTRMVRFPASDSDETTIRIEGPKDVVEKIAAEIERVVGATAGQVSDILEVAPDKHRILIGRGGEKRRSIESQFGITLDIPKQTVTGAARSQVKLTGKPEDIEKAKEYITDLVKEQQGETIQIPHHLHHIVADNNNFFRVLRNDHKVRVDHAGQQPPPRPAASAVPGRAAPAGGNLPLITDDEDSSELNYSWSLIEPAEIEESSGTIPWILIGPADNVAKAKALIEKKLASASQPSFTGHLVLPDPKTYGAIVGPGGSRINNLRKQTGTEIRVPRAGARDEAVQITGSKEGCEQCRDLILKLIRSQGQRRGS